MVEAIVLAIDHHPEVGLKTFRVVEMIDHDFRDARMVRKVALGATKRDHGIGRRMAVPEDEPGYDEVFSGQSQVRLARDKHVALSSRRSA